MSRWRYNPTERRAGLLNLAIAAAVALSMWWGWWIWRDQPPPMVRQRALEEVVVSWKCGNDHRFEVLGDYGSRPCPECGAKAFVVAQYRCVEHGKMEAELTHERGSDGHAVIAAVRFEERDWIGYPPSMRCPHCDQELDRVRRNVFARRRNKGR